MLSTLVSAYFGGTQLEYRIKKNCQSESMLNFDFFRNEKGLGIVTSPYLSMIFQKKCFWCMFYQLSKFHCLIQNRILWEFLIFLRDSNHPVDSQYLIISTFWCWKMTVKWKWSNFSKKRQYFWIVCVESNLIFCRK